MKLAALTAAGRVIAASFESDAASPEEALKALAEFAEAYPEASLAEATDAGGEILSAWAGDLARLRAGEIEAAALLDRRAAAFRPRPPRAPGARKRGRR